MTTEPKVTFGNVIFTKTDIRELSVVEEFNPLCLTLPINTESMTLYSNNANFSILNPSGDYASLQYRTPLAIYITVDGNQRFVGNYYLDKWSNVSDTLIRFNCIDIIGLLDTLEYRGGIWLTPTTVGALLNTMLGGIGVNFDLDPNLADVAISGWIPICSYREALQQVLLASGGYALNARQEGTIKIGTIAALGVTTKGLVCGSSNSAGYVSNTNSGRRIWQKRWRPSQWGGVVTTIAIPLSEQSGNMKVNLRALVTGVEVKAHDITEGTGSLNLFDGVLTSATQEIRFNQPIHTLTVSGATITESGANYAILSGTIGDTVLLSGLVYEDAVTVFGKYMITTEQDNILTIDEGSMINSNNAEAITLLIYNYYQERYIQSAKLIKPVAIIGDPVIAESYYDREITGIIEKMTSDLAGGYLCQTDVVGVVEPL